MNDLVAQAIEVGMPEPSEHVERRKRLHRNRDCPHCAPTGNDFLDKLRRSMCIKNTATILRGVEVIATCSCGEIWDDVDEIGLRDDVPDLAMSLARNWSLVMAVDHLNHGHFIRISDRFVSTIEEDIMGAMGTKEWVECHGIKMTLGEARIRMGLPASDKDWR